ncbi:MAG: response regulator, partial [Firmicutes bacterium]|nr:response regulator [Bacillota bacterium]
DVMMPKMNGYEATKAIRSLQNRPDADTIPIIAMTANAFAEDVQASLDAGMNGHVAKPISMDEIVKTIARNLNR